MLMERLPCSDALLHYRVSPSEKCERSSPPEARLRSRRTEARGERSWRLGQSGGDGSVGGGLLNCSTVEGFGAGIRLRAFAIVKLGKWILYVVHTRQSSPPGYHWKVN
jgi:hypothetical protein